MQNRPRKKCEGVVKKPLKCRACLLAEAKRLGISHYSGKSDAVSH
jgi:hypothetical protein